MRQLHPAFDCHIAGPRLVCRGPLRPTPMNQEYAVRIEYAAMENPKVWVESPTLAPRAGTDAVPHTYAPDRPCLFLPASGEWRADLLIARTVVPWLSEWLYFYEVWRATGEWLGGGEHPRPGLPEESFLNEHEDAVPLRT